ncbi:MAG: hypothetical protein AAGD38_02935 [Acidobacteriota bacterium]
MSKIWQKAEVAYLKRNAKEKSLDELSQRFHTDVATVRAKLEELGLVAPPPESPASDPAMEHFEGALPFMHKGEWAKAAELLRKVVETSDGRRLKDRARQMLAACERRIPAEDGSAGILDDPYLHAVYEKNRGNLDTALEVLGDNVDGERAAYLRASILALDGQGDEALELLETAIELEPKNRVHAYHDPDFESLRGQDGFRRLLASRS